ncbi:MAG: translation elongation factor-like protein [Candidatus Freyarchaeota archaeon]|nr:translation elongation factor-like protein [Candidatus Jordarchaeia archaeon]MBS7269252.1 translation elongation factor-like protein [Candidatus Jordarchaeia archaeon]MBS7280121.1 translation elongation factor-like protein [Candidatus Jordarchaeia archaeon]
MLEKKVGTVFTYFKNVGVAGVKLEAELSVGDTIRIVGATTDFQQKVESMQIEKVSVEKAVAGDSVGIKVKERVRPNDVVYKISEK